MNWKLIFVSVIAFIIIIGLFAFQTIGVDLAIVSLIFSLIGIIAPILNTLIKPKISLKIEKPKFEKREHGEYKGYKMITHVTNKGNKIVFNLEASAKFEEQIEVSNIQIQITNNNKSYKSSNQPFEEDKYSWIDSKGKVMKKKLVDTFRKDDEMKLLFPPEYKSGITWAFGMRGGGVTSSSGYADDILLNLEPKKPYNIEIKLKGEDNDKITVTEKKKFKIKTP